MSIKEKVYQKVSALSDQNLEILLALAEALYHQESSLENVDVSVQEKRQILNEMLAKRETSVYPPTFDYRKEMEDALEEKYGRFA